MPAPATDRARAQPRVTYPAELPISAQRETLLQAIRDNQVVVVAGETGSGKSTQLPKLCLELGRGREGVIGHTQPRRLAARTVAARIAEELGSQVGDVVGYKVRFSDQVSDQTMVKLMTDGILLAELRHDRRLRGYDTIIVDEAHERSLNIDFLLGYLTDLLPRRPDLKVIVTSATIDTERFAQHFGAPVIEVSGRSYPVEVRYRPVGDNGGPASNDGGRDGGHRTRRGADQVDAIRLAVDELRAEGPGDVLVFLNGQREIHDAARTLAEAQLPGTDILPLYARLSAAEQQRAFRPHQGRRIVLATNVAETSITVPGVRYVVDTGTARISRYNRRTKLQRLPIEPVSQASANQRAGRCGRVAPGICIRLYDEDDFEARPEFTEPEILRTNLASVILQMAELGLGEVEHFPFIDPPDARAIRDAVNLLVELGAMELRPSESTADSQSTSGVARATPQSGKHEVEHKDQPRGSTSTVARAAPQSGKHDRTLTPQGRRLARMPVDPRFGRMLLEAEVNGCLQEAIIIVAGLSIQDPRERPADLEQEADELHARFTVPGSDFLAYLRMWDHLRTEQRSRTRNQFRRMCRAEHLHYVRVREWQDLARQLREVTHELKMRRNQQAAEPDAIHRSLLAGLLSHVGTWDQATRDYRGARQARFKVAPGSVLSKSSGRPGRSADRAGGSTSPAWVMAGELVETNRLWARVVAKIDPSWIEPLAEHLVKRNYGEARWSRRRGTALTDERVLLYGLPVVPGRPVPVGRVDPELARDMFIEHALVADDWDHRPHDFLQANRRLVDEVRDLEARSRRPDLVVDDLRLAALYAQRLPEDVTSARHFERWWKDARRSSPDLLTFQVDDLIEPGAPPVDPAGFPDNWTAGEPGAETDLPLSYVFEPGADDDGVTVHVPLVLLPRLSEGAGFDWHVPGHRLELVDSLIRTLPKALRRELMPIQERAQEALDGVGPDDGPLLEVLAGRLSKLAGTAVGHDDMDVGRLPAHLQVRFSVEDSDGTVIAAGRDLSALAASLAPMARQEIASSVTGDLERSGLTTWDFGSLPQAVEARGHRVLAHPAVVDEGETVGVRVLATPEEQSQQMWAGTRRLLLLAVPEAKRQVVRRLRAEPTLGVTTHGLPGLTELTDDCLVAAGDRLLASRGGPAWDQDSYQRLEEAARERLARLSAGTAGMAADLVAAASALERQLDAISAPALAPAVADIRAQLAHLVFPGFVAATGLVRLRDLGRYLEAIRLRLDKLRDRPDRDRDLMARAQALETTYDDTVARLPGTRQADPDVVEVRWMLEELRVSLFAQTLGTAQPVSEKRVRRALAAL